MWEIYKVIILYIFFRQNSLELWSDYLFLLCVFFKFILWFNIFTILKLNFFILFINIYLCKHLYQILFFCIASTIAILLSTPYPVTFSLLALFLHCLFLTTDSNILQDPPLLALPAETLDHDVLLVLVHFLLEIAD